MSRSLPRKGPGIAGVGRWTASMSGIAVSLETHTHTESVRLPKKIYIYMYVYTLCIFLFWKRTDSVCVCVSRETAIPDNDAVQRPTPAKPGPLRQ